MCDWSCCTINIHVIFLRTSAKSLSVIHLSFLCRRLLNFLIHFGICLDIAFCSKSKIFHNCNRGVYQGYHLICDELPNQQSLSEISQYSLSIPCLVVGLT